MFSLDSDQGSGLLICVKEVFKAGGAPVKGPSFAFALNGRRKGVSVVALSYSESIPAARQQSSHAGKGRKPAHRTPALAPLFGLTCLALGLAEPARADAEQTKLVSVNEPNNPHAADLAALREYAQEIGAQGPTVASIEESKNPRAHFNNPEFLALREYVEQIGAAQPKPAAIEDRPPFASCGRGARGAVRVRSAGRS